MMMGERWPSPRLGVPAWQDRDEWLSLLEELFDPPTVERLERVGVAPGWRALEVGAGRGSIAAWLAERVGPGGRVVATDVDTALLGGMAERGVEVLRHDVLRDDFPDGSFDLVHTRAVLVHLLAPGRALDRIFRWLKPGGVVLCEEPWIDAGLLSPEPLAARAAEALKQAAPQMDCGFARRLPQALKDAGFEPVEADAKLVYFEGGSRLATFYRLVLTGAVEPLVEAGRFEREQLERLSARFEDPAFTDCGWPRIAATGWKPEGSSA